MMIFVQTLLDYKSFDVTEKSSNPSDHPKLFSREKIDFQNSSRWSRLFRSSSLDQKEEDFSPGSWKKIDIKGEVYNR
jgi:hypothetical protein